MPLAHHRVTTSHVGFAAELRQVPDAPKELFIAGGLACAQPIIAIVGARAATRRALQNAHQLALDLAREYTIVSGGAIGTDTAAHLGALEAAAGTTIVVLPCGIDRPYPARNAGLFERVVERGAVISQFELGDAPLPGRFVQRNRVIAALAHATIVVQAGHKSGALHTARAAARYRRVVGAVPGSPGCDHLLAQGAACVEDAADVVRALRGQCRKHQLEAPLPGSVAESLLRELDGPHHIDELVPRVGASLRQVKRAVCELETMGHIVAMPGQRYMRRSIGMRRIP